LRWRWSLSVDLRRFRLTPRQVAKAESLLNYQPFIITDDLQTGVAYSWLCSEDPRVKPPLLFRRGDPTWEKATEANEALRKLYDGFIQQIAARFPGASLFDVACNNGYFPVCAEMLGMKGCAGSDFYKSYRRSIEFLNSVAGTRVRFMHAPYNPMKRRLATWRRFDVVVASAIMCHLPNPLDFLAALARVARRAIFFWGALAEGDEMTVLYHRPHGALQHTAWRFPYGFNDDTRISRSLFEFSMRELGFREIVELAEAPGALRLPGHQGLLAIRGSSG
jgi:SAM-dependent methyltransferase